LLFLTFSLWASAALPTRGAAAGVATGAVVVLYLVYTVASAVEVLSPVRKLSPFYYSDASRVLLHGFHEWARLGGLLAVAALFLLLAVQAFNRRDLVAGGREWQPLALLRLGRHHEPEAA
jgi:hypothetical protein